VGLESEGWRLTLASAGVATYTVCKYSHWSDTMRASYRQNYQPLPAIHLPGWLRSLWRWL
jgi:hypothetical protein